MFQFFWKLFICINLIDNSKINTAALATVIPEDCAVMMHVNTVQRFQESLTNY